MRRNPIISCYLRTIWTAREARVRDCRAHSDYIKRCLLWIAPGIIQIYCLSLPRRFFQVAAELITHRRQKLVGKVGLAARAEALVERGGKHGTWHRLVDGGLDGP